MDNLFDSVDINDLANSEEVILDNKKSKTEKPEETGTKNDKQNQNQIPSNEGIDIADLANIGGDDDSSLDDDDNIDGKKPKVVKRTPESNDDNNPPSSQSALTSLAKVLHESGVLSSLKEEDINNIENVDALIKSIETQIKSNEFSDLSDEQKEYIQAMRDGVPHSTFVQRKSNAEQYKNLTDDVIEKAPQIGFELIKRSLIVQGVSEEKAIKLATKTINDDDGLEEALSARDFLVEHETNSLKKEIENKQKEKEQEIKESQAKIDTLKSKINETTEILPGIKVNSQTKEKIFNSMVTPVNKKGDALLNEVMELYSKDMEYKMKVHALHTLTKGFTDFSKFKNTASTTAIKELEEKLQSTTKLSIGGTGGKSNSMNGMTSKQFIDALPDFSKK